MANPSNGPFGPPTAFTSLTVAGVPTMGMAGLPLTTGQVFFCDYANGSDGNTGGASDPFKTIYWAFSKCVSGRGDIVAVVSNGLSTGSQRLSLANAQIVNSAATAGTLNWNKDNTHLVGVGSPSMFAQRARLAPPTGTYTQATFGSGNFVVVTGSGCTFANFSVFNGFSTGGTNQIAWTDNGNRNAYLNVSLEGMGDAASAADAGSRSLKIGSAGSGELYFSHCSFGLNTVTRGAANATLELAGGTPRNTFEDCIFLMDASASTPFHVLGTGASCIDRENFFIRSKFANSIKSGATTISAAISLTNASPGGLLVLDTPFSVGATKLGDTNALANSYIVAPAPNSGGGLALNPA